MRRRSVTNPARIRRYALQAMAVGIGAGAAVLYFSRGDSIGRVLELSPSNLLTALALSAGVWIAIGARIWILCRSLGCRIGAVRAFLIGASAEFGVAASPGGVGGPALRVYLLHRTGVPMSVATTVLAADALLDLLFFSAVAPAALFTLLSDSHWRGAAGGASVSVPALLALVAAGSILALAALRASLLLRRAEKWARRSPRCRTLGMAPRIRLIRNRIVRARTRIHGGLKTLAGRRKGAVLLALVFTAAQWLCRYGILPFLLAGLGHPVKILPLIFIQGAIFACSLLLVAPGGGGGAELMATLVLRRVVPVPVAGAAVVLWRIFTYHVNLVFGGALFGCALRCDRGAPAADIPPPGPHAGQVTADLTDRQPVAGD